MSHRPSNAHTSRLRLRRAVWAMVLMLALTLVATIPTGAATHQIEQQECPAGTVLDPETAECISEDEEETPPAEPTEPPLTPESPSVFLLCGDGSVADPDTGECPTPDSNTPTPPTEPADSPDSATVHIQKYSCPPGPDWYGASAEELVSSCAEPMDGVVISLHHEVSDETSAAATGPDGEIEWSEVPRGPFALVEDIPAGFGEPRVFCDVLASDVTQPDVAEVSVMGGSLTWRLAAGETLYCAWLNIPVEEEPVLARDEVPAIDAGPFSCRWLEIGRSIVPRIPLPAPQPLPQLPGSSPRLDPNLTNPLPIIPEPSGNLRLDTC